MHYLEYIADKCNEKRMTFTVWTSFHSNTLIWLDQKCTIVVERVLQFELLSTDTINNAEHNVDSSE